MGCTASKQQVEEAQPHQEALEGERTFVLRSDGSRDGYSFISRPKSTKYRLIIDLHLNQCFGSSEIIKDDVALHLPPELVGIINETEWVYWMTKFRDMMKPATDGMAKTICCYGTLVCIPYMVHRLNRRSRISISFFSDINNLLFESKGLWMKPQNGRIKIDKNDYVIPWLSLALDPIEVEQLKQEPYQLWLRDGIYSTTDHSGDECNVKCCGVLPAMP